MSNDALECFQSLLKSVPIWIADLEGILHDANKRQAESLSTKQPVETASSSRKSSLVSLRSEDNTRTQPLVAPSDPTLLKAQLPHLKPDDRLRLAQRKRKTASVCSRPNSKPTNYRSRSMVVVYYDGDVQKSIENMVRGVGTLRNQIRKGKLSAKLDSMSRRDSSSSSCSSAGEETIKGLGTFTYRTTTTFQRSAGDSVEAFDKVDNALEQVQTSCEEAAHQILRDGDCEAEAAKANQQLQTALRIAQAELPAMLRRDEKAARQRAEEEHTHTLTPPETLTTSSVSSEQVSVPSDGMLEVDTDETDESDDDDKGEFMVSAMRLPPHLGKYQVNRPVFTASIVH